MRDVPEMGGIALVMSWKTERPDSFPTGIIVGTDGLPPTPVDLMKLAAAQVKMLHYTTDMAAMYLVELDGAMGRKAKELEAIVNQGEATKSNSAGPAGRMPDPPPFPEHAFPIADV